MLGFIPYILLLQFIALTANFTLNREESTAPPDSSSVKTKTAIYLQVDTIALNAASISPVLIERIEAACTTILQSSGFTVQTNKHAITLKIKLGSVEGDNSQYIAKILINKEGKNIEISEKASDIRCELCTESEFIQAIETAIKTLTPALMEQNQPESESTALTLKPLPNYTSIEQAKSRIPLTTPGRLGIAALSVGAVSLGSGIGLQVYGSSKNRNYLPASISLITAGGLASAAGIALLVVDRLRAKSAKKSPFQAFFGQNGTAGILWYGRF